MPFLRLSTFLLSAGVATAATCNVRDYGAAGDGARKDTAAIAKAVDAGAVLLASDDPADYPLRPNPYNPSARELSALIYGDGLANITLSGRGTIDGRGQIWWKRLRWAVPRKNDPRPTAAETEEGKKVARGRPHLVKLVNCRNVWIEGLTLLNSPSWTVNPVFCEFVTVTGVTIINPVPSPNTDGINPESCRNVHISNCNIDVGDDCVTIKSGRDELGRRTGKPCENITVTNCTMLQGHGGVVVGSEMSGGVRNVTVSNCVFQSTNIGIRIKSQRGRGGVVEGMVVDNIVMQDVPEAFTITTFYQGSDTAEEEHPVDPGTPRFRDVRISNVTARGSKSAGQITGLREMPVSGISLANVHISAAKGFSVRNARDIAFHNVRIDTESGPALAADNVDGLELEGFRTNAPHADAPAADLFNVRDAFVRQSWAAPGTRVFLRVRGSGSRGIVLSGNHLVNAAEPLAYSDGVSAGVVSEK